MARCVSTTRAGSSWLKASPMPRTWNEARNRNGPSGRGSCPTTCTSTWRFSAQRSQLGNLNFQVVKDVENFREMFNCQNAEMCWVIWTRTNISWVSAVSLSNIFRPKKIPGHRSRRCRRCWRVRSTSAPCCWRCQTSPCRCGMILCFQVELPTFCWNMLK